jgi:hypothetical protein
MPVILFRCPNTGSHANEWIAEDSAEGGENVYELVRCPTCQRVHLVNPKTGKLASASEE